MTSSLDASKKLPTPPPLPTTTTTTTTAVSKPNSQYKATRIVESIYFL
jgi:hypothetical protein